MDPIDAATAFLGGFNKDQGSMQNSTVQSETHTITGTATSDSADGLVRVDLEGYTISEDDQQSLELPTTVDVHEGDTVQVTLVGGVAKSPIVTGVVGGGDRLSGNVTEALDAAQAAELIVRALNYYFFHDNEGAHVTTEPDDATTGPNALLNALALYFRIGTTNVAKFGASGSQIGKDDEAHMVMDANSMELYDENGNKFFFAGDLRDPDTGAVAFTEMRWGDGVTDTWTMQHPSEGISQVKLNGTVLTEGTDYTAYLLPGFTNWTVVLSAPPAVMDSVSFYYVTTTPVLSFNLGGTSTGDRAVAESSGHAEALCSHAEGTATARGRYSHAEGYDGTADADYTHVEGNDTNAYGIAAHAEGYNTYANGDYSHAEGDHTTASAIASHAEGLQTFAGSQCQHVGGKYNIPDTQAEYAEIIGNGVSGTLSNARTLDWFGNEELQGELYLGGCTENGETPYPATRYNTSSSTLEYYDGSQWDTISTGGSSDPKIYAGSIVKQLGSTSITNLQIWDNATFRSTFNVKSGSERDCQVFFNNNNQAAGNLGVVGSEYRSNGWNARWTTGATGGKQFGYIVAVPASAQA